MRVTTDSHMRIRNMNEPKRKGDRLKRRLTIWRACRSDPSV